ncbi:hypothetical protein VI817_005418 [Penicillium citrinum]|nr:hypothetical protein VI817_005418 [Penicillium citrinum]
MSEELDLDQLSPTERSALETYTTVTGQEPAEAIALLRRSQWNVQVGKHSPYSPEDYHRSS